MRHPVVELLRRRVPGGRRARQPVSQLERRPGPLRAAADAARARIAELLPGAPPITQAG
ncbi:hypothetical protein [Baekduia alba]|uniref:hypothetical protein n=1 Tax=Baekduia alba TaxID=2997333 RepID=UPI002340E9DF|nr:hypothetical protein [Baekduia alba]